MNVAVEGPSHSGKTTLILELLSKSTRMIALPEYVDAVDDLSDMPDTPLATVEGELDALSFLLTVDHNRWITALPDSLQAEVVLMNRSIHTLLAHRFCLEKMYGLRVFGRARELVYSDQRIVWPDYLIFVDVDQRILESRYGNRQEKLSKKAPHLLPNPIFVDPLYNQYFREYFLSLEIRLPNQLFVINGNLPVRDVAEAAAQIIRNLAGPDPFRT